MAFHYRTLGIILKKKERGEADQIFTIFTKEFGKLNILGRGIRKSTSKLRAGIELFYLSEIDFIQGKAQKTLTDSLLVDRFANLRKDFKRLTLAFKIARTLNRLVQEEESDPRIWRLLKEVFNKLNDKSLAITYLLLIYYYFLWNLFAILGYEPELFYCFSCQKKLSPGLIYFNSKEGSLFCSNCFRSGPFRGGGRISSDTIKILRIIIKGEWKVLSRLKIEPIHRKELKEISQTFFRNFTP